jgi:hypothetical protein
MDKIIINGLRFVIARSTAIRAAQRLVTCGKFVRINDNGVGSVPARSTSARLVKKAPNPTAPTHATATTEDINDKTIIVVSLIVASVVPLFNGRASKRGLDVK